MLDKIYNKAAQFRQAISRRLSSQQPQAVSTTVYTGMSPQKEESKMDVQFGSEIELFFKQGNVSSRQQRLLLLFVLQNHSTISSPFRTIAWSALRHQSWFSLSSDMEAPCYSRIRSHFEFLSLKQFFYSRSTELSIWLIKKFASKIAQTLVNFEKAGLWVGDLGFQNWSVEEQQVELLIMRKLSHNESSSLMKVYGFELGKILLTLLLIAHLPYDQIVDELCYASQKHALRKDADLSELLDSLQKREERDAKFEKMTHRLLRGQAHSLQLLYFCGNSIDREGEKLLDISIEQSRVQDKHHLSQDLFLWSSACYEVNQKTNSLEFKGHEKREKEFNLRIHGKDLVLHWGRNWFNIANNVVFLLEQRYPAEGPGLRWGLKMMFQGQLEEGFFNMNSFLLESNGIRLLRSSQMEIGRFSKGSSRLEGLGYRILLRVNEIYFGNFKEGEFEGEGRWFRRDGVRYKGRFKKGLQDGQGVEICKDFSFIGHFKEGKREGKGTFLHQSKNYEYEGNWKDDMRQGYGKERWFKRQSPTDAVQYEGNFEKNKREKKGTMFYKNGSKYIGNFKNGRRIGYGVLQGEEAIYKGNWEEDAYNGEGQLTMVNQFLYKGEFNNGMMQGKGEMTIYKPGTKAPKKIYTGEFKNNERSGQGKIEAVDGSYFYEGEWVADLKHGEGFERSEEQVWGIFEEKAPDGYVDLGKVTEKVKKYQEYRGNFYKGVFEGKGELKLSNGDVYKGDFIEGRIHGMGRLERADGTSYEGFWKDNQPNGWLTKLFPNGDRYQGQFKAGQYDGYGSFFWQNGFLYEGHWRAGKMNGNGKLISNLKELVYDGNFEEDEYKGPAIMPPPLVADPLQTSPSSEQEAKQDSPQPKEAVETANKPVQNLIDIE